MAFVERVDEDEPRNTSSIYSSPPSNLTNQIIITIDQDFARPREQATLISLTVQ